MKQYELFELSFTAPAPEGNQVAVDLTANFSVGGVEKCLCWNRFLETSMFLCPVKIIWLYWQCGSKEDMAYCHEQ